MIAPNCPNCGARFQSAEPGTRARCNYCGTETFIPRDPVSEAELALKREIGDVDELKRELAWQPRENNRALPLALSVIGMVTVVGVAMFVILGRSARTTSETVNQVASINVQVQQQIDQAQAQVKAAQAQAEALANAQIQAAHPKLTLANLATTPFDGQEPIDAPGMVGTLDEFDLVANIEWAKTIARAWTEDAQLHRLAVQRVERDGLVNLRTTPEAQVWYRFISPKRIKECEDSASATAPHVNYELFVFVTAKGPMVQKISGDGSGEKGTRTFSSLPACPLTQALKALDKANKLPAKPYYNADFYDFGGRPSWKLDTVSGTDRIPSVEGMRCTIDG
jgi:hypothetical protein